MPLLIDYHATLFAMLVHFHFLRFISFATPFLHFFAASDFHIFFFIFIFTSPPFHAIAHADAAMMIFSFIFFHFLSFSPYFIFRLTSRHFRQAPPRTDFLTFACVDARLFSRIARHTVGTDDAAPAVRR